MLNSASKGLLAGMVVSIKSLGVAAILAAISQPVLADDPIAIYQCYVYSFGHEDYVRQIKLQPDGSYDAWANAVAGKWGVSGRGRFENNDDGTVTFIGGPLNDAVFSDVSDERPYANYFTVLAPGDDRGTMCKMF